MAVVLYGPRQDARVGTTVEALEDINGDGHGDLLVAGHMDPEVEVRGGRAWVLHGPLLTGGGLDAVSFASVRPEGGWEFVGIEATAVGDLDGDLDGDELPDLAIAAPRDTCYGGDLAGKVHLFPGTIAGSHSGADAAMVLQGEVFGDHAGKGLAGGFDADGDGWSDLAVGAYGHDAAGDQAGRMYLATGLTWAR